MGIKKPFILELLNVQDTFLIGDTNLHVYNNSKPDSAIVKHLKNKIK